MQKLVMIHTNHGPGQSELENQCLKSTEVVTEGQRKTSRLRRGLRAQAGRCLGEQWLGLRPMSGLYLHVPGPLQGCRGKMGSICCFARLIISSGILWLNFCEARGLTSLLMMVFFVSSLYEWPQILNRYKFSHKFLDLELTQGSPHHQKSGSLEIKDLTLTS